MVNDDRLKIYLYHIPQVSGVGLSIPLVKKLHTNFPDIIVGIKDSSGDWDNTKALLSIDGLIVYPGAELPVIDAIRLGAPGCISATANLNGTDIAEVIALCHAGAWDAAEAKHKKVCAVRLLYFKIMRRSRHKRHYWHANSANRHGTICAHPCNQWQQIN